LPARFAMRAGAASRPQHHFELQPPRDEVEGIHSSLTKKPRPS
jgi:hypothetical protein